jgi:hypothetical protein
MSLMQIMNLLKSWMDEGKTGQVEINFREGQIRNYTVRESFWVAAGRASEVRNDRIISRNMKDKNLF